MPSSRAISANGIARRDAPPRRAIRSSPARSAPNMPLTWNGFCQSVRKKLIIDGAGHRIQQERVDEVNATLIAFSKKIVDRPTGPAAQ